MAATFIGRCRRCRGVVRVEAPIVDSRRAHLGYGRFETRATRQLPNGTRVEGITRFFTGCWCGGSAEFNKLVGAYSEHKKCDPRCMNAKGHTCDCSCAGANHGAGWAA